MVLFAEKGRTIYRNEVFGMWRKWSPAQRTQEMVTFTYEELKVK